MTSLNDVLLAMSNVPVDDPIAEIWGRGLQGGGYTVIEYTGTLPITINANGQPLLDYRIYGNTEQTGTPTPENPIMPIGCGERTENLVESIEPGTWSAKGFVKVDTNIRCRIGNVIGVIAEQSYTIHCETTGSAQGLVNIQYKNDSGTFIGESGWKNFGATGNYTATIPSGTTKITIILTLSPGNVNCSPLDFSNIMLNLGSTALPYEPYGYKLPILSNSTVTNIYLGEVETTRRIKKLVLTGNENWGKFESTGAVTFYINVPDGIGNIVLSTHFLAKWYGGLPLNNGVLYNGSTNKNMIFRMGDDTTITDVESFKSYLAAQYAAGTPVTVWYVLAEPETDIVNEPLMKIGNYTDTVDSTQTAVQIPTSAGTTVIDYNGTTKPSQMYIKYLEGKND